MILWSQKFRYSEVLLYILIFNYNYNNYTKSKNKYPYGLRSVNRTRLL